MDRLADVQLRLLLGKTWRYLRYLHLREALTLATGAESVLVVGAGNALAELAIAIERPELQFIVTDHAGENVPSRRIAEELVRKWGIKNIRFGVYDALQPPTETADVVASVEVLEHIKQDEAAAANMGVAARKYVFCLVPFADRATNANQATAARVWEKCQHFRVGYDADRLSALFPNPVTIRGCYWKDAGFRLRSMLTPLDEETIKSTRDNLASLAATDVRVGIPRVSADAQGIWILSKR